MLILILIFIACCVADFFFIRHRLSASDRRHP